MATKLETLLEYEGYDIDSVFEDSSLLMDSVSPGICMNPDCDYTTEVEPDCRTGYCEECGTQSVKSLIELLLEIA